MASILGFDIVIRQTPGELGIPLSANCSPQFRLVTLTVPQGTDPVLILFVLFHEAAHVRQHWAGILTESRRLDDEIAASKYAARRMFGLGIWPTRLAAAVWGEEVALGCSTKEIVAAFTRPSITLP